MPDVREILKALSPEDRIVWEQCRTEMRRAYLTMHNSILGITAWDAKDDAFIDLIDIKIATLFDRGERLQSTKDITGNGHEIEKAVMDRAEAIKPKEQSQSAKLLPETKKAWEGALKS